MSLIRWAPLDDVERLFGHLGELSHARVGFDLAVDVYEEEGHVIAEMHIPGVDAKKLDIEVDGELLKISGAREEKKEQKQKNFFSREIKHGSFERVITLPKKVLSENTRASYVDGILKVSMPIANVPKRKKVVVS